MTFTWLSRTASNTQQVAAVQANAAGANVDASPGSITLALVQAVTGVSLWLQGIVVSLIARTRAATSVGPDLDSWMADFSLTRLGGVASSGSVTFSRATATSQGVIAVGALVSVGPGGVQFAVQANTGNSLFNVGLNAYVVPAGTASVTMPVQCTTVGVTGNVLANTITSFYTPIPYFDTVNNAAAFTNGIAGESDASFYARFAIYLLSLARATRAAVGYAVSTTPGVVSYSQTDNYDPNGAYDPGSFYVVVDDGTGSPPSSLIAAVETNVAAYAAEGIRFAVLAPTLVAANVLMNLITARGYNHSTQQVAVTAAITSYINTLPVGASLSYLRLAQVAFDASPGITDILGMSINGLAIDLGATSQQVIRTSSVGVI